QQRRGLGQRNCEVHYFDRSVFGNQDIFRLEISMDDALAVHIGKGAADLTHDVEPCGGLDYPLFPDQRAEGDAIDILHRDIHPAFALGCKHAADIGMVEATADFLFALETTVKNHVAFKLQVGHLDCDGCSALHVPG